MEKTLLKNKTKNRSITHSLIWIHFCKQNNMHTYQCTAYVAIKVLGYINISKQPAQIWSKMESKCVFFSRHWHADHIRYQHFPYKNNRSGEKWLIAQQQSFTGERETAQQSEGVGKRGRWGVLEWQKVVNYQRPQMRAAESTRRIKEVEREQQRCWSAGNVTTRSWGKEGSHKNREGGAERSSIRLINVVFVVSWFPQIFLPHPHDTSLCACVCVVKHRRVNT